MQQNANFGLNNFSKFYKDFIECAKSWGCRYPGLSMHLYRDLYTIFSQDLTAQPTMPSGSTLNISIERRDVPDDAAQTLQNPRNIVGYFVILSECKLELECLKKAVKKIWKNLLIKWDDITKWYDWEYKSNWNAKWC